MAKKRASGSPFQRRALTLAWEGWYATWELVHWFLPYMYPRMSASRRRETAQATLEELISEDLVRLRRFHFTKEQWLDVPRGDADDILTSDRSWQPTDIQSWQVQFLTTPEGNRVCTGPPRAREGWTKATWWLPKKRRIARAPTMPAALRHLRRYIDGDQTVYDFYHPLPETADYYRAQPDDPLQRLCYFYREIDGLSFTTLRWGSGDQERVLRTYAGLWLVALKLSRSEWQELVDRKTRPLDHMSDWGFE